MLQLRTILHPTDFSDCAEKAFVHALYLARHHHADLHVLHVQTSLKKQHLHDPFSADMDEPAYDVRVEDEAQAQFQALVEQHAADEYESSIHWVLRQGLRTATTILDYEVAEDVDLIVLGTHGRHGLRHLLLGSVAEEVVRRAACPVLTIREPDEEDRGVTVLTIRRVVVPIDFSHHALNALRYARELAAPDRARLDLLHVIDPVQQPTFYETGLARRADLVAEVQDAARHELEAFFDRAEGPDVEAAFYVQTGYPPQAIAAFAAEQGADLIVMASHGLRGLERYPMGSVTEHVVREAPCPVFITRPFGKSLIASLVDEAQPQATPPGA